MGTHSIALMENHNVVHMLDVPGKLQDFARERVGRREIPTIKGCTLSNDHKLWNNFYDVVICSDCLEHVPSPLKELQRIHKSMKTGGIIHLLVSTMRKPSSGHFDSSIDEWLTKGKPFMAENFTEIKPTIYRKE